MSQGRPLQLTKTVMTAGRAKALLQLLRISRVRLIDDLNRLTGNHYDRHHAYKWLTGVRAPPPTLTLYLRMRVEQAWRERLTRQANATGRTDSLLDRTKKFLARADAEQITRFNRRLTIFEDESRPP